MDIKTAYLYGELKEEIYMEQLEGFIVKGQEKKVCKLVKSIYGLKQAGQVWYELMADTLRRKLGFERIHSDAGVGNWPVLDQQDQKEIRQGISHEGFRSHPIIPWDLDHQRSH